MAIEAFRDVQTRSQTQSSRLMSKSTQCLPPPRRSARLQDIERQKLVAKEQSHFPSPPFSDSRLKHPGIKRKHTERESLRQEEGPQHWKRRRLSQPSAEPSEQCDPVTHWILTSFWPRDLWQRGPGMADTPSSKRRSDSSHRSQVLERMATHGVFMESSNLLRKESKTLCGQYLKGSYTAVRSSIFTPEEFSIVLDRVRNLNEARIQRDITPWVVPSAEILSIRGELEYDWIGEELNAEWVRCATLGSTRPKPDYVAGLRRQAFTSEELKKLDNHATPTQPFHFTPELCFPFLICEVKMGDKGLNEAARQNIHSASITVRAIFALYKNAFGDSQPDRIHELYGQILVFTVSHDSDRVELCGHFAVADTNLPQELKFYRYQITLFSLAANDGADRDRAYNFVRQVYQQFAPDHRKRIKDAVTHLPLSLEQTGLSFAASDLSLNRSNSQEGSEDTLSKADSTFKKPGEPPSSLQKKEIEKLREQTDKLLQQLEKQRQDSGEQMEQLRLQMEQQLEKQRQDSKAQMEQQRQQMEQIISLLKASK